MSIAQHPPVMEAPTEITQQQSMVPAVQVLWLHNDKVHYFVRGHPHLHLKDAALQLNGEHRSDYAWKGKRAWDANP